MLSIDCLREEAVAESCGGGGGMDALVPPARWHEGEKSMRGVKGVVRNAGGFVVVNQNYKAISFSKVIEHSVILVNIQYILSFI